MWGKGNHLNGCSIKPRNDFNFVQKEKKKGGEGEGKEVRGGVEQREGHEYPLTKPCMIQHVRFKCFILCPCLDLLYFTM